MIPINRAMIDNLSKQHNSKNASGKVDDVLYSNYASSITNLSDLIKNYSVYEMAHWINYTDRFCNNKLSSRQNSVGYKRGTIVFVDLGAGNFGHEPSYTHPAVVIAQNKFNIMIAPCSSKKYGKGIPQIIDATINDGFSFDTGIQMDSTRWISKDRVISVHGTVNSSVLDKMDNVLLSIIPTYKRKMLKNKNEISQLKAEKKKLEEEKEKLNNELQSLKNSIKEKNNE